MKIVISCIGAVGHLNPVLALTSELVERGHLCRIYPTDEKNKKDLEALPFAEKLDICTLYEDPDEFNAYREAVDDYEEQDDTDKKVNDVVLASMKMEFEGMPQFLEDVKAYRPDLIIYDPFLVNPAVAAYILNVPACSTITFPGFNYYPMCYGKHTEEEKSLAVEEYKQSKTLLKYRNLYLQKYSFDIFSNLMPMTNYLPKGLNLCTGIKDFELEMPEVVKEIYGEIDKDCLYVGPMLLTQEQGRVSTHSVISEREKQWLDEPFPYEDLREYKRQGKKIIYAAFGTVATGKMFWENDVAPSKMFGAVASGKVYCRTLWERIFKAFGGKENYVVVMATVAEDPKALEGFEIPANFIVRRKCPQLDVLQVADAFITHGGANSMIESINSHVPMLVLPWFSDQYDNAKMVSEQGVGLHYDKPLSDCTADFLASDILRLLINRVTFISNAQRLQKSLARAGGAEKASRAIEEYVASFQGHEEQSSKKKKVERPHILTTCRSNSFKEDDYVHVNKENDRDFLKTCAHLQI